jgi:hypothetical protein
VRSSSDPIEPVPGDGLAFVRKHPKMFQHLVQDGPSAAALLAESAMRCGARRVEIAVQESDYYLSAEVDWLADLAGRDPFTELVPFPALGANAVHPEVVVAAFSELFETRTDAGSRMVVGEPAGHGQLMSTEVHGRAITFRLALPIPSE